MKKKSSFLWAILIFSLLLVGKVLLSGAYLHSGSAGISAVRPALAGEKEQAGPTMMRLDSEFVKKEKELEEWEARLKRKEAELIPLKKEVETKMAELNDLQTKLTALAGQLAEKEQAMKDEKMGHLVSLYSAMDPARAAAIMGKLKIDTVVLILRHMKGKSAGQILAMMDPEKGAVISEELSRME